MLSTRKQETRKKGNLIKYEGGQVVKTTELLRAVGLVFTSVYLKMLTVLKKLLGRSKKCENDLHILN